jgi:hypothetical protein
MKDLLILAPLIQRAENSKLNNAAIANLLEDMAHGHSIVDVEYCKRGKLLPEHQQETFVKIHLRHNESASRSYTCLDLDK